MKIRGSSAFRVRMNRVPRFILFGSLIAILLLVASLLVREQIASHAAGRRHSAQAAAGESGPPDMMMPATTDGGALGQDLAAASISPSDLPSLNQDTEESGFYDVEAVLASQDDLTSARTRYIAEGLLGGYLRVFRGTGGIREVQASILAFSSPVGAARELEFWKTDTVGAGDVTVLPAPSADGSFAVSFKTDVEGNNVDGTLMAWVNGSNLNGIYVAAQGADKANALAKELAGIMESRE